MTQNVFFKSLRWGATAALGLALAACAAAPKQIAPTTGPFATAVNIPPPRPSPPFGTSDAYTVPPRDAMGNRVTINTGLSTDQTIWHLRSGWNVAALNCNAPRFAPIATGYGAFLETHAAELSTVNKRLDQTFNREYGRGYARVRDTYMTNVYNYFSHPPASRYFCDAALQLANQWAVLPPENLEAFAMTELADLDAAFEQSFQVFEQYQRDVAAWDARYGAEYGAAYGVYPNAQPTVQPTVQSIGVGQDISSAGNADEAVQ